MEKPARGVYGPDRLVMTKDGTALLSCRYSKGWVPRREADLVHSAFPGTCVRWEEEFFEVIQAEPLPVGVRYVLRRWDDAHVMRVVEDYDAASELRRDQERRKEKTRKSRPRLLWLLALVVGTLPAEVQERLQSEYGIRADWMTIVSIIPWFIFGTASLFLLLATLLAPAFGGDLGIPVPWLIAGMYFFLESGIRFAVAFLQSKPMGSILGVVPWVAWVIVTGRFHWKAPAPRLQYRLEPSVLQRDAYTIREPLLALLPQPEQAILSNRYGFDPMRWGRRTAGVLIFFALLGIASSVATLRKGVDPGAILSLALAAYLFAEQLVRIRRFSRGEPAGSVIGILARPFLKKLLA